MITRRDALAGLLAMPSALTSVATAERSQPIHGAHRLQLERHEARQDMPRAKCARSARAQPRLWTSWRCMSPRSTPARASHPPHRHVNEELIILREGECETLSNRKPATRDPAPALLPALARSAPCTPSRAHPIQPRYRSKPTRDSAAGPAGPCADREYGFPSPPAPSRSAKRASERIAACVVVAQAAGPAGCILRRIARQNAAAARDQQKRRAIPLAQQLRHAVQRKPLADGAQIELQAARSRSENGMLLRQ
jgi:XRE family transcriptional regulator, regulator of sulfur utilization